MTLSIRNPRDFWSGVIFLCVGVTAMVLARDYPLGSTFKMGPGYFPTLLGGLLALVGVLTVLRGLLRVGPGLDGLVARRATLIVLTATVLFGVLLRGAGLAVAVTVLVIASAHASRNFRWGATVALAAGMAAFCVAVFVIALGLPIPIIGPWFGE